MTPSEWLVCEGRRAPSPAQLLDELCARLNTAGLEIVRANVVVRILHPQIAIISHVWKSQAGELEPIDESTLAVRQLHRLSAGSVDERALRHGRDHLRNLSKSPFQRVFDGERQICIRLCDGEDPPFSIVADLRRDGISEYVCFPMQLNRGLPNGISFATTRAGGFSDEQRHMLEQLVPLISLCFEAHVGQRVARAILTTYLGEESGERVLAGHIQRGDVESIQAAIWFSDLRGFTQLSQTAPPEELVSWLNRYFGIVFPAIRAAGGEVLKLMGDGVLGMFRVGIERSERAACEAALTVALRVEQRLRETAEDDAQPGLPTLRQGVALHVGDLQYGNIGDDLRLDFTVIGTAVNLASRIEGLCSRLARPILVSQAFADCLPHAWESHGPFELKGLTDKQRVYSPALVAAGHRL